MQRVVVDTNILIASIFWNGIPYKIVEQSLNSEFEIIISDEIINEVKRVLQRDFKLSEQEINDIISVMDSFATRINSDMQINIVRDEFDNHVIASAICAEAKYIITRDLDLLVIREYCTI